ncbi:hypothetical protein BDP55DRAFT_734936 [Colletotrichum godetiae]|uniref:Uncharacterized protein n=1 Tax=Colletotrichum godetiae TaxID=1209918 RepID=A0AAJ0ENC5_9PEZI|nr:uncharacterized protein BDP55DRAFT_734936 [Colletotrichum godetiae]KAK1657437.1 hypothetical protein BDP55DRAFT_734936 [Colletotrichum godetiae]
MHELKNELQTRVDGDFQRSLDQCLIQELFEKLTGDIKVRIYYELREDLMRILKRDITFKLEQDIKQELRLEMGSSFATKAEESMRSAIQAAIPIIQDCVIRHLKNSIGCEVKGLLEDIEGAVEEQEKVLDDLAKTLEDKPKKASENTMVFQVPAWATMVAKDEVLKLRSTLVSDLHNNLKAEIKQEFSQNMEKVGKGMIDE